MSPGDHLASVQNLVVTGTQYELRHRKVQLMDCGWSGPSAHITFQNVSDGSARASGTGPTRHRRWSCRPKGGDLPTVKFLDGELMGYHQVQGATTGRGKVVYDGCNFSNITSGGVGPQGFLRHDGNPPSYRFVDCYGVPDSAG